MGRNSLDILDLVAGAVAEGRVGLAFQPVVEAARPHLPAFHEGLVRLFDPAGTPIPAGAFIEQVEGEDLGRILDCIALRDGIAALQAAPGLRLSLNMSPLTIGHRTWIEVLDAGLDRDPTVAERLILEFTEHSAMSAPRTVTNFMRALQGRGISFALDDFGSGHTSFRQFRDLRFDIIKIDGGFCRGVHADPDSRVLVEALVRIAHHFECVTVAEMVEAPEDADVLCALGIDAMQGWLFGRPTTMPDWLPAEARRPV